MVSLTSVWATCEFWQILVEKEPHKLRRQNLSKKWYRKLQKFSLSKPLSSSKASHHLEKWKPIFLWQTWRGQICPSQRSRSPWRIEKWPSSAVGKNIIIYYIKNFYTTQIFYNAYFSTTQFLYSAFFLQRRFSTTHIFLQRNLFIAHFFYNAINAKTWFNWKYKLILGENIVPPINVCRQKRQGIN